MYNAPAVSFSVGRSRFHGLLLAVVIVTGGGVLILWGTQVDTLGMRQLAATVLWLMAAGWALQDWLQTPIGTLAWDGQVWVWICNNESLAVDLDVAIDSQGALLLCLQAHGRQRAWLWPERRMAPTRWSDFRRAVFAAKPANKTRAIGSALP
jgi:hypothetical protein